MAKRVAVAMSGGVDSSVAAALLRAEGYDVIGITMQIWPPDTKGHFGGCCGIDAVEDARQVASRLDFRHYVVNLREVFAEKVIANFCEEYRRGRTPNPCIRCNQFLKFDILLEKVRGLGIELIATGHHARVERDTSGTYLLKKGVDQGKDQSYFLYILTQAQLAHVLMPIGNLTKAKVREIASELQLPVAAKRESQEICFIPDNDYAGFIRDYLPEADKPGPILDEFGNSLGTHQGISGYTIGQRRGLKIAAGQPLYVIAIDPARNAVIVGDKHSTYDDEFIAFNLNWVSGERPTTPKSLKARIRYRAPEVEATIGPSEEGQVQVRLAEPQMAITPGQAVVFYDVDSVVGGGTIEQAIRHK